MVTLNHGFDRITKSQHRVRIISVLELGNYIGSVD